MLQGTLGWLWLWKPETSSRRGTLETGAMTDLAGVSRALCVKRQGALVREHLVWEHGSVSISSWIWVWFSQTHIKIDVTAGRWKQEDVWTLPPASAA